MRSAGDLAVAGQQGCDRALADLQQDLVLVAEVHVEGGGGDADLVGDLADRGALVAVATKMRSAASRISARRRWPSPLALRADLGGLVSVMRHRRRSPALDSALLNGNRSVAASRARRLDVPRLDRVRPGYGRHSQPLARRCATGRRAPRGWTDYALIDSGGGRKLERYGRYSVVRPEPQCLWRPRLAEAAWAAADAVFDPSDEDDAGRWRFARAARRDLAAGLGRRAASTAASPPSATWPSSPSRRPTGPGWTSSCGRSRPDRSVLNLFGYTGVASLVCAAAGAAVTHVDASKQAVGWARENAELSGLADRPIRWICEDARKYVQREVRRGVAVRRDHPRSAEVRPRAGRRGLAAVRGPA